MSDPSDWLDPVDLEFLLFHETNRARSSSGLDTLAYDPGLATAAKDHSEEMAHMDYFSHTSPISMNEDLITRLGNAGVDTSDSYMGENISRVRNSARAMEGLREPYNRWYVMSATEWVLESFLESPAHRENILSPYYTRLGVGVAFRWDGRNLWLYYTQDFWGE